MKVGLSKGSTTRNWNRVKAGEKDRDAGMVADNIDRSMASDELCGKICR